jgi:peroxiredoxin
MNRASLLVTVALSVASCAPRDATAPQSAAAASDFTARDTEGNAVRLSKHLGKDVILLSFCATWCEPCVAEFPHLRKLYDARKGDGLVLFAIAMDGPETVANVSAFARRNQLTFPMLTDEDSRIASLYNPKKSAPLSVLIDKSGRIARIREGYNPGDEELLAKDVAEVLAAGAARP